VVAMPEKDNYWLLRIGSGAALLGAVLAGVGNLLHPITPRDDPPGVAQVIAGSDYWTLIHLVIVIGIILMPAGLLAVRHSIPGDPFTDALTRLGMYAVTIGATVGVITLILDGVAAKQLADQWAAAPEPAKPTALAVVQRDGQLRPGRPVQPVLRGRAVRPLRSRGRPCRGLPAVAWMGGLLRRDRIDPRRAHPSDYRRTDRGLADPNHHRPDSDHAVAGGNRSPLVAPIRSRTDGLTARARTRGTLRFYVTCVQGSSR
jgi:hypothetical protein